MEYISILTFVAGYIISEIIRRMNRAETFNAQIFEKRLDVFAELYSTWNKVSQNIFDFIEKAMTEENPDSYSLLEEQFRLVSPLLSLLDEKALFFSEELCIQCGAAFLGPDDYSKESYEEYLTKIRTDGKVVKDMI